MVVAAAKKIETISPELRHLLTKLGEMQNFPANSFLHKEGEEAKYLYIVYSGFVRVNKMNAEGKEFTLRLANAGNLLGELTLFSDDANYLTSAKAVKDTRALRIDKKVFENEIIHNPYLLKEFLKWVSLYTRRLHMKYRDLMFAGKKGAVYAALIRSCNTFGVLKNKGILINIHVTNQQIANFAGVSREIVNKMLSELKSEGVISIVDRKIMIHDLEYLRKEVQCEDCPVEVCTVF